MRPILPGLLLLLAACVSEPLSPVRQSQPAEGRGAPGDPEARPELPAPAPWTDAFTQVAVLVADRIQVEGPRGLLDHMALRSDDALYARTVQTLPEGFRQVVRPRRPEGPEVRGQLDAWQLAAFQEIVVLERPGDGPVVVTARGQASWSDIDGQEKRDAVLVFRGTIGASPSPLPGGDPPARER